MLRVLFVVLFLLASLTDVHAAIRYVSLSGSDANSCAASEDITTPKRTFDQALNCMVAGDVLYIRGGTWTERLNLQDKSMTGTAGSWMGFYGYPGETVTIRYTDTGSYGGIKARGARGYFIFDNLIIDGVNYNTSTRFSLDSGNHHFWFRNVELKNAKGTNLFIGADDVTIEDSSFHDSVTADCVVRPYGLYVHHGSRIYVRRSTFYQNPGGGIQAYPGPLSTVEFSDNKIYNNGSCPGTSFGGMVLGSDTTGTGGGSITNVLIYNNLIHDNGQAGYGGAGTGGNTGGPGHGLRLYYAFSSGSMSLVKVFNNTIYHNESGTSKLIYGIEIQGGANNLEVRNNIVLDNENGQIHDTGTGNTITHNACKAGDSCGSTGKVTVTGVAQCLVDAPNGDFRLIASTNPCVNAGTAVSTRPTPVGTTDLGPFERGAVSSAAVASGFIEVTISAMSALLPSSVITGFTMACVGCTGTPVVTAALKTGSTNIVLLTVSGLSGSGTCTISKSGGNLTDSADNGGIGVHQSIDNVTALAVTGPCANTSGVSSPGGLYAYYTYDASNAADQSGGGHNGTITGSVTYATGFSGLDAVIPTDATYTHIETPYGSGVNPTTQSVSHCDLVLPDLSYSQKVVSSTTNGTSQRFYTGWATVSGQLQWGMGIQTSGFSTGSEFPVTANWTLVCIRANSATDTATLSVNRVIGTVSGKSTKTYTSFVFANNFRTGNDGTFTTNNGGFQVAGTWTWDKLISDAEVQSLYDSLFPVGGSATCYGQVNHRAQLLTTYGGSPVDYGTVGATVEVPKNRTIMMLIQLDCTTTDGPTISVRPYYSLTAGGSFDLPVPASMGSAGVSMYGFSNQINTTAPTSNISGGLTNVAGSIMTDSEASQSITMLQNRSTVIGVALNVGDIAGQVRCFAFKQDNGATLGQGVSGNGACIRVVESAAGGN